MHNDVRDETDLESGVKPKGMTPHSLKSSLPVDLKIAVIIPCYNEENTVATVVQRFQEALPRAKIYVYDNNSTDNTAKIAAEAGAIVRSETRQGKGFVIRRAFFDIFADVYLMVDGDDTYDAGLANHMIQKLLDGPYDYINGARRHTDAQAYRFGHTTGNKMLTGAVGVLFGRELNDMLSGYKVFSNRFVKSFPAVSQGFEIETEIAVHALELELPILEVETEYSTRPEDSPSKLNTFRDGFKILFMILRLFYSEKPVWFFSYVALFFAVIAIVLSAPVIDDYLKTGLVERFPTAILSGFLSIIAVISVACGVILDLVQRGRHEAKRLHYLALKPPSRS